jgi:hypothetical protein
MSCAPVENWLKSNPKDCDPHPGVPNPYRTSEWSLFPDLVKSRSPFGPDILTEKSCAPVENWLKSNRDDCGPYPEVANPYRTSEWSLLPDLVKVQKTLWS